MQTDWEARQADINADMEVRRLRTALKDIAEGNLGVTDAMLESKESMMTALANYCQARARLALTE